MALTPTPASDTTTGSRTMADLMAIAAERYAGRVAARYKADGAWHDVTYAEAGAAVDEIALGLIDIGVEPGDRVSLLCTTRLEWTLVDFAISSAGAVVVPVYPTNSPEECEWVAGNSESVVVVCEDASQVLKIARVRERLPKLRTIVVIDSLDSPGGEDLQGTISLAEVRDRGAKRDASELNERRQAVRPEDPFTFIYTSGTTGPPKGCVLSHGNYRSVLTMVQSSGLIADEDVTYLFLPLAHSFALLVQLGSYDAGACIAYFGGDNKQIVPELSEVRPTYLPSVPRIFEKIYTLVTSNGDPEQIRAATQVGLKVRYAQLRGEAVPAELQQHFDAAEEKLFKNVRAAFGGHVRQAVTGAAPIAQEILEFFFACGVPVLEGYGMTETSTVATFSTIEEHRFGTVGKLLHGQEGRIAEDGELLLRGPNIFGGYYKMEDASFGAIEDGWLHTGDLGHIDDEGYVSIVGRKKDIIITAGGKNLTPANLENDLKQSRWISQAVMHGDRRPFPVALVTLDPEEIVVFAREHGLPEDPAALSQEPKVHALVQGVLDEANVKYAQVEQIKKFVILDHDLSQETGELTPTLKVKRNVVNEKYADLFEGLYSMGPGRM